MYSDARQIVQTVSTIAEIPKSDGVYFFNVNLKLLVRDIRLSYSGLYIVHLVIFMTTYYG